MEGINIEKYFTKTEKNLWVGWEDYILKGLINTEYPYFNTATLHKPIKQYLESKNLEHRMWKIVLHRYYDIKYMENNLKEGVSEVVYKGLIEDDKDLEFLMVKLGITSNGA